MFSNIITMNQFHLKIFDDVVADIPADRLYEKTPGNGHSPVWLLGHLALCGELGLQLLGGQLTHPQWLAVFGPGTADDVPVSDDYARDILIQVIKTSYPQLSQAVADADQDTIHRPHELELLSGTAITTVGQLVSHLLSTHFAFHLAQLSAWRRAAGHAALY